jgi:hypothetical protein
MVLYMCASQRPSRSSVVCQEGRQTGNRKKKSLSSIWFVWKWFKWWDLHQCIRLIRKLVFSIIKFVGAIFSHTNTHPSFSAGWLYIRFFGTGRKKGMNKNTGYTQWVWLPGYGVLGFWSFRPMRFRVLEFRFLRFGVFFPGYSNKHWPYAGDWARRRICGIRHGQTSGLRRTCFTRKYD